MCKKRNSSCFPTSTVGPVQVLPYNTPSLFLEAVWLELYFLESVLSPSSKTTSIIKIQEPLVFSAGEGMRHKPYVIRLPCSKLVGPSLPSPGDGQQWGDCAGSRVRLPTCPWRAERPGWRLCCLKQAHTHSAGSIGGFGGQWTALAGTRNTSHPRPVLRAASGAEKWERRLGNKKGIPKGVGLSCPVLPWVSYLLDLVGRLVRAGHDPVFIFFCNIIWCQRGDDRGPLPHHLRNETLWAESDGGSTDKWISNHKLLTQNKKHFPWWPSTTISNNRW